MYKKMMHRFSNILSGIGFYVPVTFIALLILIPFFWMITTSLKTQSAIYTFPVEWIPSELTLENYITLFTRFPFGRVILNSAIVSISYTMISLILSCMAAFAFAKLKFKGSEVIFKIFIATLMIPFHTILIPLFIIMSGMGLNNTYISVIIPSIFKVFVIFMLVQNMKTIPNDYIDAARMDGASNFTVLWKIIVPFCGPTIATLAIIMFVESMNDFLWPLVMLTKTKMMTMPVALSILYGQFNRNIGVSMAGSLISIIPIIIVYLIAQRKFKSGLSLGGIKG